MKNRFGRLESMALAYVQMRKLRMVRTGELAGPLRLSRQQERGLFRRLLRSRLVARIRSGVYLFPPQLPVAGEWAPDEAMALGALMTDVKARYQVCGPNAFNRYGFDEQIPNRLYAYNDRISGERTIGTVGMTLIKVAVGRLGDTETVKRPDGEGLPYSSRVRTLVDAVYDWSRFNGLPRGLRWIRDELAAKRVTTAELARCAMRYGDVGTKRRIGCLMERIGVRRQLLAKLRGGLGRTQASIALVPGRPKRGRVNARWGVVENDRPGDIDGLPA